MCILIYSAQNNTYLGASPHLRRKEEADLLRDYYLLPSCHHFLWRRLRYATNSFDRSCTSTCLSRILAGGTNGDETGGSKLHDRWLLQSLLLVVVSTCWNRLSFIWGRQVAVATYEYTVLLCFDGSHTCSSGLKQAQAVQLQAVVLLLGSASTVHSTGRYEIFDTHTICV